MYVVAGLLVPWMHDRRPAVSRPHAFISEECLRVEIRQRERKLIRDAPTILLTEHRILSTFGRTQLFDLSVGSGFFFSGHSNLRTDVTIRRPALFLSARPAFPGLPLLPHAVEGEYS